MLNIILALSPSIAIAIFIYDQDKYEKEPIGLMTKVFLYGSLSTLIVLFASSFFSIRNSFLDILLKVGFLEEIAKYSAFHFAAYKSKDFNEPFDAVLYCVMAALGFATIENLLYVFGPNQDIQPSGTSIAIARMFTAVPMHACLGVIVGFFVGMQKFLERSYFIFLGLIFAATIHGIYDYFLLTNYSFWNVIISVLIFSIVLFLSKKVISYFQQISPFKDD